MSTDTTARGRTSAAAAAVVRQLAKVQRGVRSGHPRRRPRLPLHGHPASATPSPLLDALSDADLEALNELLPWSCFTADGTGRRFGGVAWAGKRQDPQPLPDPRILRMAQHFDLASARVLEIGCFEGVHTIALCRLARQVVAVDSRIENVVKTLVRCAFYGAHPDVRLLDVDGTLPLGELQVDVVHHVGVLYHLRDPVSHLRSVGHVAGAGVWLDTHVATEAEATEELVVGDDVYRYRRYAEGGRADVFSGMHDHAKWLTLDTIVGLLAASGLEEVEVIEERQERNGTRVLLAASRQALA